MARVRTNKIGEEMSKEKEGTVSGRKGNRNKKQKEQKIKEAGRGN